MRIGLLGGTFNPIHCCHLHIAEQTRNKLSLDQIIFIPSGDPPHKSINSLVSSHDRLEMVKQAIFEFPHFRVSEIESKTTKKSYAIDTLKVLREQEKGELWFIIGLDAFLDFQNWKSSQDLLSTTNFVVISRPEVEFIKLASLTILPPIPITQLTALDARERDRLDTSLSSNATLILLNIPPCPMSASIIRDRIKQGREVSDWLPASVESYIIQKHLYGA